MTRFHSVKLELLRSGPSHNQLLSPLTPYLALCGEGSPITFHIDLEHRNLLNRLERLRYLKVDNVVREATVGEVGEEVGTILSAIPALLAEVSRARGYEVHPDCEGEEPHFVHLSLVLGGSELSLIPFELGFSPQSFPGEGLEFCLQLDLPVVPTRETRRSRPAITSWDSSVEPKLLIIAAAPEGLEIPLASHIQVLRDAMEPWIAWPRRRPGESYDVSEKDRLPYVKERMRVLSNASVEQIRTLCARERFTHVHILAHGDYFDVAGERHFGVALCDDGNPALKHVVDGKRLAQALQAEANDGTARSSPVVVTLATCDSGHQGSVLVPGGSIAYDLHAAGIPWVFASQFPLTKNGSVRMTDVLYRGLLRGDDPRRTLYEVRRRLYMSNQRDHDWASMVVYASVPKDFDRQVAAYFEHQAISEINTALERADDLDGDPYHQENMLNKVNDVLDIWRTRLPGGFQPSEYSRRAECYGMHGSAFKRIALLRFRQKDAAEGDKLLRKSLDYYRKAMDAGSTGAKFHWVATQALAISATLKEKADPYTFELTWHMAHRNLQQGSASDQAWAHGTLAELEMVSLHHKAGRAEKEKVAEDVIAHCKAIVDLMGYKSFHVESTRRQFRRYVEFWNDPRWDTIAAAAVAALTPPTRE